MNTQNFKKLQEQLESLGFSKPTAEKLEKRINQGDEAIALRESHPARRGSIDLELHFRRSRTSDNYYFNNFTATQNTAAPLKEGEKYMVILPGEKGKNTVKDFQSPYDAVEYFKGVPQNAELAMGTDPGTKLPLVSKQDSKVTMHEEDFRNTFYSKPVQQTFWIDQGKNFTAEQAVNLLQGRGVFRDDLVSRAGERYAAWNMIDFNQAKEGRNFKFIQKSGATYDLKGILSEYPIKELDDPKKADNLIKSLQNGNRALVTMAKEGGDVKIYVEAVPQYKNVNLTIESDQKMARREDFLKPAALDKLDEKNRLKEFGPEESQGVKV